MITSTGNSRIRKLVQLRKKAKERDAEDVFLVEGIKMKYFRQFRIPGRLRESSHLQDSFITGRRTCWEELPDRPRRMESPSL